MIDVIHTEGLSKDFGSGRGVYDVTLSVRPAQVFGFLGPNGAGKSTFVKTLIGLIRPTSGRASVLGLPIGHRDAKRRIGYLPELFRFQEWLTAEEVLRLHARLCGMPRRDADGRIAAVLGEVDLSRSAHERVRRFSKGMQQRLGIACALLNDPDLIFLDEPSSALDPLGRHDVVLLLQRLASEGRTIFLNTHLLEDVEAVCDEVALLWAGHIRSIGSVTDILRVDTAWIIDVGGWTSEAMALIQERVDCQVSVLSESTDGSARLRVEAPDREILGWFNHRLHEEGITIYEVNRIQTRLTDWFLAHASQSEEGSP